MDDLNRKALWVAAYGFAMWFGGGAVSYSLTKNYLEAKHEKILHDELVDAREFYARLNKTGTYSDPTELAENYQEEEQDVRTAVESFGYSQQEAEPEKSTEQNVFKETPEWDMKHEIAMRKEDPTIPYVIHAEEFMHNDDEYEQVTLTYFAEDDVLVDEKDEPIPDVEATVDSDNLARFGHGSKDNNVVHVRNERLKMDFEILYSGGSFAKEVLGFIEHSDRPGKSKIRKFRE